MCVCVCVPALMFFLFCNNKTQEDGEGAGAAAPASQNNLIINYLPSHVTEIELRVRDREREDRDKEWKGGDQKQPKKRKTKTIRIRNAPSQKKKKKRKSSFFSAGRLLYVRTVSYCFVHQYRRLSFCCPWSIRLLDSVGCCVPRLVWDQNKNWTRVLFRWCFGWWMTDGYPTTTCVVTIHKQKEHKMRRISPMRCCI